MPNESNDADLAVAHFVNRKCSVIIEKSYRAFRNIIREYETLSADEIFAIGVNLFMATTLRPLEKMSDRPAELRKELSAQLALMIEKGSEEGH